MKELHDKEIRDEIKKMNRRLKKMEDIRDSKINLEEFYSMFLNSNNLKKGAIKIISTLDKMDKENVKDYVEIDSKELGKLKLERGLRIKLLDDKDSFSSFERKKR